MSMTIYLDDDYKCHTAPENTVSEVVTDYFDGKCPVYIEGYRFVPFGQAWTRPDGVVFRGEMVAPWRPWRELDAAQREYEREQMAALAAQNAEYEKALSEIEEALSL